MNNTHKQQKNIKNEHTQHKTNNKKTHHKQNKITQQNNTQR